MLSKKKKCSRQKFKSTENKKTKNPNTPMEEDILETDNTLSTRPYAHLLGFIK